MDAQLKGKGDMARVPAISLNDISVQIYILTKG